MATENEDLKVKELEDGSLEIEGGNVEESKEESTSNKEQETNEDQRLTEDEDHEDEQGGEDETDAEAEARRQRNRERRAQNKANRKGHIDSLRRELAARDQIINDLSARIASVEQHSVGNQMAQIDTAMQEAANYYNHFKSINQQAIEQANGQAAVEAQEKMFAAQQRYNALKSAKANMSRQATQQPAALDPRVNSNAQDWMSRNEWYDPSRSDEDSYIVGKLDDRLVQEGWNPATAEYWEELDSRIKKYLPHRLVSSHNRNKSGQRPSGQQQHRAPVAGSDSGTNSGTRKGYVLSAERVQALKDAGIYDDPTKRADAIKRFQEYDRSNGKN